jgi:hypothetical protein
MQNKPGTPSTLDHAIADAICVGPLNEVPERAYHVLRDFMAQKFGTAYLTATHEQLVALQAVFEALTRREK